MDEQVTNELRVLMSSWMKAWRLASGDDSCDRDYMVESLLAVAYDAGRQNVLAVIAPPDYEGTVIVEVSKGDDHADLKITRYGIRKRSTRP